MLDRLRGRLQGALLTLGRGFAKTGLSPTAWTIVGALLSFASAAAFNSGGRSGEVLGGALLLSSGFFDIVDGAVARATGVVTKRGAFLDSNLDRVAEVAIFFGVLAGGYSDGRWVVTALGLSLLVSYARAKGDALGVSLSGVGVGERSERLLTLSILSVAGYTGLGVDLVAILAAVTFIERLAKGGRLLGGSEVAPNRISSP